MKNYDQFNHVPSNVSRNTTDCYIKTLKNVPLLGFEPITLAANQGVEIPVTIQLSTLTVCCSIYSTVKTFDKKYKKTLQ